MTNSLVYGVDNWSTCAAAQRTIYHIDQILHNSTKPMTHHIKPIVQSHHTTCTHYSNNNYSNHQDKQNETNLNDLPEIAYLYKQIRCVILLDVSPSIALVNNHNNSILFESMYQSVAATLLSIATPIPNDNNGNTFTAPSIWCTVIAQDWSWCPVKVIIQNCLITYDNISSVLAMFAARLGDLESQLATVEADKQSSNIPDDTQQFDLIQLLQTGLFALDRMSNDALPVLVLCSDGVVSMDSSASAYNNILQELDRNDVRVCVLQLSSTDTTHNYTSPYGYISDHDTLQFLADSTAGAYYDLNDIKHALQYHHSAYQQYQSYKVPNMQSSRSISGMSASSSTNRLQRNEDICVLCWLFRPLYRDIILRSSAIHSVAIDDSNEFHVVRLRYKQQQYTEQHNMLHSVAIHSIDDKQTHKLHNDNARSDTDDNSTPFTSTARQSTNVAHTSYLQPSSHTVQISTNSTSNNSLNSMSRQTVKRYVLSSTMIQSLICRVREGFRHTVLRINTNRTNIASTHLVIEWKPSIYIEYHINQANYDSSTCYCSVHVVASAEFIDRMLQKSAHRHYQTSLLHYHSIWQFINGILETDTVLQQINYSIKHISDVSDQAQLIQLLDNTDQWLRWFDTKYCAFVATVPNHIQISQYHINQITSVLLRMFASWCTKSLSPTLFIKQCTTGCVFIKIHHISAKLYGMIYGFYQCTGNDIAYVLKMSRKYVLGITADISHDAVHHIDVDQSDTADFSNGDNDANNTVQLQQSITIHFARTSHPIEDVLLRTHSIDPTKLHLLRSYYRTHCWSYQLHNPLLLYKAYQLIIQARIRENWLLAYESGNEATFIRELYLCAHCRLQSHTRHITCTHTSKDQTYCLIQYSIRQLSELELQCELWMSPTMGVYHMSHTSQSNYTIHRKELYAKLTAFIHCVDLHLLSALNTIDTIVDQASHHSSRRLTTDYMCSSAFSYSNDNLQRFTSRLRPLPNQETRLNEIKKLNKSVEHKQLSLLRQISEQQLQNSHSSNMLRRPSSRSLHSASQTNMNVHAHGVTDALKLYTLHRKHDKTRNQKSGPTTSNLTYWWLSTASTIPNQQLSAAQYTAELIPCSISYLLDQCSTIQKLSLPIPDVSHATTSNQLQARQLVYDMIINLVQQFTTVELVTQRVYSLINDDDNVVFVVLPAAPISNTANVHHNTESKHSIISPRKLSAPVVSDGIQSDELKLVEWLDEYMLRHCDAADGDMCAPIQILLSTCSSDRIQHPTHTTSSGDILLTDGKRRSGDAESSDLDLKLIRHIFTSYPLAFASTAQHINNTSKMKRSSRASNSMYGIAESPTQSVPVSRTNSADCDNDTLAPQLNDIITINHRYIFVRAVFIDLLDQVDVSVNDIHLALQHCRVIQRGIEFASLQLTNWSDQCIATYDNDDRLQHNIVLPRFIYARLQSKIHECFDEQFHHIPDTELYYHKSPQAIDPLNGISTMFDPNSASINTILQCEPFFMKIGCTIQCNDTIKQSQLDDLWCALVGTDHLSDQHIMLELRCYSITADSMNNTQYTPLAVQTALAQLNSQLNNIIADTWLLLMLWYRYQQLNQQQLCQIVQQIDTLYDIHKSMVPIPIQFVSVNIERAKAMFCDRLIELSGLQLLPVNIPDKHIFILQHSMNADEQYIPFWCVIEILFSTTSQQSLCVTIHKTSIHSQTQIDQCIAQIHTGVDTTCKRVNQECLLRFMNSSRLCSQLLIPMDESEQHDNDSIINDDLLHFKAGELACPLVGTTQLQLFERVSSTLAIRSVGPAAFSSFSVSNRNNVYVYQQSDQQTFYMRLRSDDNTSNNTGVTSLISPNNVISSSRRQSLDIATAINVAADAQQLSTPNNKLNSIQHSRVGSNDINTNNVMSPMATPNAAMSSSNINTLILDVYGLSTPSEQTLQQLNSLLHKKLDTFALSIIGQLLVRNTQFKLTPSDHRFLRPLDSRPDRTLIFPLQFHINPLNKLSSIDIYLFIQYFKQNMDTLFNQMYLSYNVERDRLASISPNSSRRSTLNKSELTNNDNVEHSAKPQSLHATTSSNHDTTIKYDMRPTDLYYIYNNYTTTQPAQLHMNIGKGMAAIYCSILDTVGHGPFTSFKSNVQQPWYTHAAIHDYTDIINHYRTDPTNQHPILVDMIQVPGVAGGISAVYDQAASGFDLYRHMRLHKHEFNQQAKQTWYLTVEYWSMGQLVHSTIIERLAQIVNYSLHEYIIESMLYCQRLTLSTSSVDLYQHTIRPLQAILHSATILQSPIAQNISYTTQHNIQYRHELVTAILQLFKHVNKSLHLQQLHSPSDNIVELIGGVGDTHSPQFDRSSSLELPPNLMKYKSSDSSSGSRARAHTDIHDEAVDGNTCTGALNTATFSSNTCLLHHHIPLPKILIDSQSDTNDQYTGCINHRLKTLYRHCTVYINIHENNVKVILYNWSLNSIDNLQHKLHQLIHYHTIKQQLFNTVIQLNQSIYQINTHIPRPPVTHRNSIRQHSNMTQQHRYTFNDFIYIMTHWSINVANTKSTTQQSPATKLTITQQAALLGRSRGSLGSLPTPPVPHRSPVQFNNHDEIDIPAPLDSMMCDSIVEQYNMLYAFLGPITTVYHSMPLKKLYKQLLQYHQEYSQIRLLSMLLSSTHSQYKHTLSHQLTQILQCTPLQVDDSPPQVWSHYTTVLYNDTTHILIRIDGQLNTVTLQLYSLSHNGSAMVEQVKLFDWNRIIVDILIVNSMILLNDTSTDSTVVEQLVDSMSVLADSTHHVAPLNTVHSSNIIDLAGIPVNNYNDLNSIYTHICKFKPSYPNISMTHLPSRQHICVVDTLIVESNIHYYMIVVSMTLVYYVRIVEHHQPIDTNELSTMDEPMYSILSQQHQLIVKQAIEDINHV